MMMDGEKELEGHRRGTLSFAAMLFGQGKRRTSPVVDDDDEEYHFSLPPSPKTESSGEECRSRTGSSSVTDLPESEIVGLSRINERKKQGRENRGDDEEEEERADQKPNYHNVDDGNVITKEEFGEEEEEEEGADQKPNYDNVDDENVSIKEEFEEEEEEVVVVEQEEAVHGSHIRRFQKRLSFREVRHFPPPIPLLAQTGNLPCHMPWILKRTYKKDGRLVLREVNLKHHEFFRAHRSNGRLTLRVVHFEDASRRSKRRPDKEEDELTTPENDPPPSPASPRPSSNSPPFLKSPPPPSDRDDKTPPSINSPPSVSSLNYEQVVESSINTTTTSSVVSMGEKVNASMGNIVGGLFANSLLQMPIPTIRPIHS